MVTRVGATRLVRRSERSEPLLIALTGEIDIATELAAPPPGRRLIVDMSGVTFAGSAFLTWLVAAKRGAAGMVVRRPSAAVLHLLKVSGLLDEFSVEQ